VDYASSLAIPCQPLAVAIGRASSLRSPHARRGGPSRRPSVPGVSRCGAPLPSVLPCACPRRGRLHVPAGCGGRRSSQSCRRRRSPYLRVGVAQSLRQWDHILGVLVRSWRVRIAASRRACEDVAVRGGKGPSPCEDEVRPRGSCRRGPRRVRTPPPRRSDSGLGAAEAASALPACFQGRPGIRVRSTLEDEKAPPWRGFPEMGGARLERATSCL
jgi:hypothetical protein